MKNGLIVILLILILARLFTFWLSEKQQFLIKFNPQYYGKLYSESQYVIGQKSIGGIGDDGLYAFAGYYYFFQGGDVSSVNFEHPPLGKYLIGLSIFLFKNANVINIIYFLILCLAVYKIAELVLKNVIWQLLPVILLVFDPLFLDHTLRSQLDLPFSLFFITAVYFYLLSLKRIKFFYLSQLFWGLAFSTRFFPFLLIIELFLFTVTVIFAKKNIMHFLQSLTLVPLIYLLSHLSFFLYHPSMTEFFRHKIWMLSWYRGTPVIFGNIWNNIFSGWYLDSTKVLLKNQYWIPVIPIMVVIALFTDIQLIRERKFNYLTVYGLSLLYLIYLTVLTNGLQKFLLPVYPLLIILALHNLLHIYSIILPWKRKRLKQSGER